jgi:hypothetical protein
MIKAGMGAGRSLRPWLDSIEVRALIQKKNGKYMTV